MWELRVIGTVTKVESSPSPLPLLSCYCLSDVTWLTFQLQTANVILTERGSQLNLVQRDTEHQKSQFERLQEKIRLEKVSDYVTSCQVAWSRYHTQLSLATRLASGSVTQLGFNGCRTIFLWTLKITCAQLP